MSASPPLVAGPDDPAYVRAARQQAIAADPFASVFVAANAGSGKTRVLIDRVARLLLEGAEPSRILCVTYTKNAAAEMQERLYRQLGRWSVAAPDDLGKELRALTGADLDAARLRRARELFARALETPGGLKIETIHAFADRLLRRFPIESGISPGFAVADERESAEGWRTAVRSVLAEARGDPELRSALLRIAADSPGVGAEAFLLAQKSRGADVARFVAAAQGEVGAMAALQRLIGAPDESEADLVEAFLNATDWEALRACLSTLESADRKPALLGPLRQFMDTSRPRVDRLLAWLGLIVDKNGKPKPLKGSLFAGALGKREPLLPKLFAGGEDPDARGDELVRLGSFLLQFRSRRAFERSAAYVRVVSRISKKFQAFKLSRGRVDFDDIIDRARALLDVDDPGSGAAAWVLYKLDDGLDHILLDEAQDTSPEQWPIFDSLTAEIFAGRGARSERQEKQAGPPGSFFVVGDFKQSIFGFQGADPESFTAARRAFIDRALGETPDFAMSFRSAPEVLGFVDQVFAGEAMGEPPPWRAEGAEALDFTRHEAFRSGQPGLVELWDIEPPPPKPETDHWTAPIDTEAVTGGEERLAARIAVWARDLLSRGDAVWEQRGGQWAQRPARAEDILVLVRSRAGMFDAVFKALKAEGVPVAGADRLKLLETLAVQDCLNLMRAALARWDDLRLAELLKSPFIGWLDDEADLAPLAADRQGESLWARLQAGDRPQDKVAAGFLRRLIDHRGLPPGAFLSAVLDGEVPAARTGWTALYARFGEPVREPVAALIERAWAHPPQDGAGLQDFVAAFEATGGEIRRDLEQPDGAVRVMTVHGAKGLEAPIVVLAETTAFKGGAGDLLSAEGGAPVL